MDLKGKVAIVTGGASGIGFSIVEELLANDVKAVVIADINKEYGINAINKLTKTYESEKILFQETDVSNKNSFEETFKITIAKFKQIDIIVNNAGIGKEIDYEELIGINMTGGITGTLLAIKYMGKDNGGNGGVVLSISSIAGIDYMELFPIYSATKGGILNLMRGFGHPHHYDKHGIRMLALLPGITLGTNISSDSKIPPQLMSSVPTQTVQPVSRSAIHLFKNANSGSAWVIIGNKLYMLEFPDWSTYGTLAIDYSEF